MMLLEGRTVVILSPQPWNYLQISKHHYARSFSLNNRVFFVEPPATGIGSTHEVLAVAPHLSRVRYRLPVPAWMKFKFPALYRLVATSMLRRLLNHLPPADLIIDFGCYQQFSDMSLFASRWKIFFPVDDMPGLINSTRGADLVLSVSPNIQSRFPKGTCQFIHHGLSEAFVKPLETIRPWAIPQRIKVGMAGNLFIRFLDIPTLRVLITSNEEIQFHMFGSYEPDSTNPLHISWDEFLKNAPNVVLRGFLSTDELAQAYEDMDAFLVCYKPDYVNFHGENSHKVVEFLSSGKAVVSTFLSVYRESSLLAMTPEHENERLPDLFRKVITDLAEHNAVEVQTQRRRFALSCTYTRHVDKIDQMISALSDPAVTLYDK